jgi:hypothetical protein
MNFRNFGGKKMEKGDECWLPDGRKAEYAGEIDGQKFVRVIRCTDDEYGGTEWPDERMTAVSQVYESEPADVYGSKTQAAEERLNDLLSKASKAREDVAELCKRHQEIVEAAKKYPDISMVLDFIEGRITHVVEMNVWSKPKVTPLEDALKDTFENTRESKMKLLALFGNQESIHWGINRYSDGSGLWTTIIPAKGLDDARRIIKEFADKEIEDWRNDSGEKRLHVLARYGEGEFGIELPSDIQKAIDDKAAKLKAARIAKAEEDLAKAKAD